MKQCLIVLLVVHFFAGCTGSPSTQPLSSSAINTASSSRIESSSSAVIAQNNSSSVLSSTASSSSAGPLLPLAQCEPSLTERNRMAAAAALDGLFIQKDVSAIDRYWADPYLQHNPVAASGVNAFKSFMTGFVVQSSFKYERLFTLADCDWVVIQGRYSGTGVIFDMFRMSDGKFIEHWDSDSNNASAIGTAGEPIDKAATELNRALVKRLYSSRLVAKSYVNPEDFFSNSLIVRRAPEQSGSGGFFAHIQASKIEFTKLHYLLADGNYVFALAEGLLNGTAYGFYDVYRLEDGAIVEQWDSRRRVPTSTLSNLGIF